MKWNKRTIFLALFVGVWTIAALGVIAYVKPEFWRDGYSYYLEAREHAGRGRIPEAILAMDKALGRDASDPGYLVYRASLHAQSGNPEAAAADYRAALSRSPQDPEAALGLAKTLFSLGRDEEALPTLEVLNPQSLDTELLRRRAGLLAQHGQHARAVSDFRVLADRENDPSDLRGLASSLMALKDFVTAEKSLERYSQLPGADAAWATEQLVIALRAQKKVREAYAVLADRPLAENARLRAELALEAGLFQEAAEAFALVVRDAPADESARIKWAVALRAAGKPEQAYDVFTSVPVEETLVPRAELALELERFDEAAALFAQLEKRNPSDASIREKLAYSQDKSASSPERLRQAEAGYRDLVASGEATPETRERYAWLLMRAKRYDEAFAVLSDLDSGTPGLATLLADAAFLSGRFDKAVPLLREHLEADPGDAVRRRYLADALDALKRPGEAALVLEAFRETDAWDIPTRIRVADLWFRDGRKDKAAALYQEVLALDSGQHEAILGMAGIHEAAGRHDQALALLMPLAQAQAKPSPELLWRIARLYSWKKAFHAAADWYRRALAAKPGNAAQVRFELAQALLEGGDPASADRELRLLGADTARDPDMLRLTARTAMALNDPARAVAVLTRLAGRRPLTDIETLWLAGQLRLAGRPGKALEVYEGLFKAGRLSDPGGLEALGDLRADAGNPSGALAAYQAVPESSRGKGFSLKLARAADRAGKKALAREAYARAASDSPNDPELLLEAARFLVSAGKGLEALPLYDAVVSRRGSTGLGLELALANLAVQRFPNAEKWARQAVDAGEGGWKSILALAQALHLQGRTAEADRLLTAHAAVVMAHPEGKEWMGYVAVARDRHLEAFDIFSQLLDAGAGDPGNLWLWRGIAATRRGDYARARESFDMARTFGATKPATPVTGVPGGGS